MAKGCLSDSEVQQYHSTGFLLTKGFYDREEIELLKRAAKEDRELTATPIREMMAKAGA